MLSFVDVKPDEFWQLTPAETRMILDRKVNDDKMAWNHTSAMLCTILQPHVKKGARISPDQFHPYRSKTKMPSMEQVAQLMRSEATIRRNAELKEAWKIKGRKSVFEKLREKKQDK